MKRRKIRFLDILFLTVVCVIFLFSLYKVVTLTLEYKTARAEYEDLRQYAAEPVWEEMQVSKKEQAEPSKDTTEQTEAAKAQEQEAQEEITIQYYEGFADVRVDFDALEALNEEVRGWLYIPSVDISYPIVLGEDNDYYLTHTFQRTENKSGAVFLDAGTLAPFEEDNTVIHGHNMKDGSMFGRLKRLYQDKRTYAAEPYFYIYTREKTYKYLIFDTYVTAEASQAYQCTAEEKLVTLSTCYGRADAEQWLIVQGILTAQK